jgi:hypothetical protein
MYGDDDNRLVRAPLLGGLLGEYREIFTGADIEFCEVVDV